MERELQEKVLIKIKKDKELTKEEKEVVTVLEEKGLVKISKEEITLTHYGQVISVRGYDSVIRAEEMEKSLSSFSSDDHEKSQLILVGMFALILAVLLLILDVF